jgi:hypothetical protein
MADINYEIDAEVLFASNATKMEHWMPLADAILVASAYITRRLTFSIFINTVEVVTFDGKNNVTGDPRLLESIQRHTEIFETTMKQFFLAQANKIAN